MKYEVLAVMGIASGVAAAGVLGAALGHLVGVRDASESFYENCRGGEVYLADENGHVLTLTGCAEIARKIK